MVKIIKCDIGYWNLTELHYTKLTSMNNSYLTLLTELQIINVTTLSPPKLTTTNHFYLQKKSPHIFLKCFQDDIYNNSKNKKNCQYDENYEM